MSAFSLRCLLAPLLLLVAAAALGENETSAELACHAGAYRLDDGRLLAITPSDGETLRYRAMDGASGRLHPDGTGRFVAGADWASREPVAVVAEMPVCDAGTIRFSKAGAAPVAGQRVALEILPTAFENEGVRLAGRLLMPAGGSDTVVVLVHGSESTSAQRYYALQYFWPASGIGVFVYDKRGTGESQGKYTQDFNLLARDAVAALAEARRLAGSRATRFGIQGGSQGGWIGPLAATMAPFDFAIASFGMAEGPLAEDREQVQRELRELGYGQEVLAQARELTDATAVVMKSRYRDGLDRLAEVKKKFRGQPWLEQAKGEFTGDFVKHSGWALRTFGPSRDQGTSWEYEPRPTIERVSVPMLWVLAGRDQEAPSETTHAILREIQPRPGQLDIAMFPTAGHGIIERDGDGADARPLGHSPGYFQLLMDWVHGETAGRQYGNARLEFDTVR